MEGMERVVASVSGYHGSERLKLSKLISLSGASFVGAMSRSTTHLVCWKFEGEKYQLAKKLGTKIVNHQWFEDCIKKGKRIPEKPYTRLSGQQVGLIKLDVSAISKEVDVMRENRSALNDGIKFCIDPVIDVEYEITEHHDWDDRWLFAKSEESSKSSSRSSRKQKKRVHDGTIDTISIEPPRTSRRLVKMKANRYPVESLTNNGTDFLANEILNVDENVASTSNHYNLRNKNKASIDERYGYEDAFTCQRRARNQGSSEVTYALETDARDLILPRDGNVSTPERTLQNASSDAEKVDEELRTAERAEQPTTAGITLQSASSDAENVNEEVKIAERAEQPSAAGSPKSLDLSCVICWTKFSSTRGVLPCGHRFCFSCIQNWADCMVSKGQTSTCPLCKSSFTTITRVDETDCVDQKIYSQTLPYASSTQDIVILPDGPPVFNYMQGIPEPACCQCQSREPEDLLVECSVCRLRCIHCYCLDPPLFPWTCSSCRAIRMFY